MAKQKPGDMEIIPGELATVLEQHPDVKELFYRLSSSHRREYVHYVADAKKETTRHRRAHRVLEMIREKYGT